MSTKESKPRRGSGRPKVLREDAVRMILLLPQEDYDKLVRIAIAEDRPPASQARYIIKKFLNEWQGE